MRLHEIESNDNTIYFAFINSNPPTFGYKRALDTIKEMAKNSSYIVFINPAYDGNEFPLNHKESLEYNKKVFPNTNFYDKDDVKNPIQALKKLSERYTSIYFITRDNSIKDYSRMREYAENWNVESFDILGLGDSTRPLPTGTSKKVAMDAVIDNDYDNFKRTIPTNNKEVVSNLFISLRKEVLNDPIEESVTSDNLYSLLYSMASHNTIHMNENKKTDRLGNYVLHVDQLVNKMSNLKLVLGDKFKSPKLGKDAQKNYVIMLNTDVSKLQEYMDLHEHTIKDIIKVYMNESTTSSSVASVSMLFSTPITRDIDYSFIKDIKKSNSLNKHLDAMNHVINTYGLINSDIIATIEDKLNV